MVSYTIRKEFKDSILKLGWRFNGQRWFCPKDHLDVKALTVPSEKVKHAEQIFSLECNLCGAKIEDEEEVQKMKLPDAKGK